MAISVHIPSALRAECGGAAELQLSAATVRAALDRLEQNFPAVYRSVCDESGAVRRHIHLYVNNTFVSPRAGLDTPLAPGDALFIMTAVSGG